MMRVCLVNALFHPFSGGIEKHMYELSRELVRQGVDVTVVTGRINGLPEREDIDGVDVRRVPCRAVRAPLIYPPPLVLSPLFYFRLGRLDDELGFDIIHLHNRFFIDFNMASVYARLKNKPFVMTAHNPRPKHVASAAGTLGVAYDWLIGRWPFILADRVIAVSDWTKHDIAKYGVDKSKIVTIHNGINVDSYRPRGGGRARERYGVRGNMLLFVGRMVPQKGIGYLLEAMPCVLRTHPGTKLVLVGRGSLCDGLRRRARELGLDGNAVFSGYVEEDELKEAYGACDLFILPSTVEPFGIVVAEAMASGKPVVCTDSGGVREIVDDGSSGFVVPPGSPEALAEKINTLLSDARLRADMGLKGREAAERRLDWKLIAEKTKRVYEDVLSRRANP
ncbi:putative glycosyltransferase [Methanocella paludicola SANAE]|uniref:Glycosyltransferase n=1 Tax=Methanocella paludicola (strain DSM 17711 / JCM 13418 / NBRC 101707 / SANAE) TaxID=304371 RepID=D1YUU3_METPS|nr:glycosyltransferase family 4 protein [Methanocella paludicola]BAI60215.1 putative glycosyltransferase [Methanocella paludicola SANAE]